MAMEISKTGLEKILRIMNDPMVPNLTGVEDAADQLIGEGLIEINDYNRYVVRPLKVFVYHSYTSCISEVDWWGEGAPPVYGNDADGNVFAINRDILIDRVKTVLTAERLEALQLARSLQSELDLLG